VDCELAQQQLTLYFDGELARADAQVFETHLLQCQHCQNALAELDQLRRDLWRVAPRTQAPATLRARIGAALGSASASPGASVNIAKNPVKWHWLRTISTYALAMALGGVLVAVWLSWQRSNDQLAHDLFASHWRALAANSPVDVRSSDRHTVKPWFAGKLAQAPQVIDLAAQGLPLIGARLDYLGSERVAVLVYQQGQHVIDVFVLPEHAQVFSAARRNGYLALPARLGDQQVVIVADMDQLSLEKARDLLEAAR
jgi:anti-sigma factor RsiW